jgi:hypothetical protein
VLDARRDRDPLAVDLHALFAVDQTASTRADALVAGEEDGVLRVRQGGLQVVEHPAPFGHPARRDHD